MCDNLLLQKNIQSLCENTVFLCVNLIDPSHNEKFYRQLIEWIRVKGTESLVEALETNPVDLNFINDACQTLLNWAAAFGSAEMVEYLATKGAE